MTVTITDDSTFDIELTGRELEPLMSVIRETAQSATSAAATAVLIYSDPTADRSHPITLTDEGPIDRALQEFCLDTDQDDHAETAQRFKTGRPCRTRQVRLHGSDYILVVFPFAGQRDRSHGVLAFALHAGNGNLQATVDICSHMTRCAEMIWTAHDGLSDLALEVVTLANHAARLQRIAEIDPLTQLENSASFEEKVRSRLESGLSNAAFVALDIDHFKLINDLYGHQFGDLYLKTISRALRSAFPDGSIIGRLGGDEFGVLTPIPSSGRPYLEGLLTRSRTAIQRASAMLGKPDLGKISIGACQYPDHGEDYPTLYAHADAALYAAKESGRSFSAIYQPSQHRRYNSADLSRRFHAAVADGDIRPYFQPVVDLNTGACSGFEILARWRSKSGQNLEPSEFSAIFRDHTMAELMTRTVMHAAFRDYADAVTPTGLPLRLALNVTFFDLMNPEFAFEVQHAVADTGFDWARLTIEVTEQTMLGEPNGQIFRSLKELRARGALIALDDFGTGYGGLRHVANWPVDMVKIDKFFVDGLAGGDRDRAVLEAVLSMCDSLGLTVIAEGIETQQQIATLRALGCPLAQGYAFDRPLSGADLRTFRQTYDLS
ncbi:putative bifunctional diguanylate cyclase/phosphodiesterase [Pseudooceanicola onchidii]|uniref:putative bifunctional diguanylate cyclase/phosphodiesterase n=1 Tax=Pseudooceanicola onchidii TaxID=2562279 RepID=UPI0010AAA838|nr:bifunctional diguanylate cyclase/phosphodiesterase [Pseudooceanicola onchidii]